MEVWNVLKSDIGKRITFKAVTRWSCSKATRVIQGITLNGRPEVRYGGWSNFVIRPEEIIKIHR